jgi:3-dehydro-L-gulonate 2-dehydrogenase
MQRAMELAREHGLGCVALADTSHWMRAGTYGWQAADAGFAAMCWTNTLPNLPPWGASTVALGNNPLVVAIPRRVISKRGGEGTSAPIVLDMAMSQFSYGTLEAYRLRGDTLPVPGGYDEAGELTTDPAAIEGTHRALPIGYWKGSGLSFVLDVLAAMLTGGAATHDFSTDPAKEVGQSQVFLAVSPSSVETIEELSRFAQGASVAQKAIDALHAATPLQAEKPVRYPGEGTLRIREESMELGVVVEAAVWDAFVRLEAELSHV